MGLSVPEVALVSGHKTPAQLFRYTEMRSRDVQRKLCRSQTPPTPPARHHIIRSYGYQKAGWHRRSTLGNSDLE